MKRCHAREWRQPAAAEPTSRRDLIASPNASHGKQKAASSLTLGFDRTINHAWVNYGPASLLKTFTNYPKNVCIPCKAKRPQTTWPFLRCGVKIRFTFAVCCFVTCCAVVSQQWSLRDSSWQMGLCESAITSNSLSYNNLQHLNLAKQRKGKPCEDDWTEADSKPFYHWSPINGCMQRFFKVWPCWPQIHFWETATNLSEFQD